MGGPDSGYLNRSGSTGSQRGSSLKLNAKEVAKTLGGAASVAPGKKHDGSKSVWLEAWNDPIAGLKAYQPCVGLCDLFADGDWRLVVADMDRRLKVWKGTQLESDNGLLERASALQCFYMEHTPTAGAGGRGAVGRVPSLAVAAGAHVYIYRNLRPYYKHTLSCEQVSQAEAAVWGTLAAEAITAKDAEVQMQQMLASGVTLSQRAMAFLDVTDEEARASLGYHTATKMSEEDGSVPPQTVVTCLAVLRLGLDEAEAAGCLVLGTESGRVLILDQKGATVRQGFWVGAAPAFLATSGTMDVDYFIAIATRDNHIHLIRQGVLTRNALELEAPAVGLLANPAALTVACMNSVVHSFSPAGQREGCLFMPAPVVAMSELIRSRTTSRHLVLALANMQVRVYSDKTMVSMHTVPSPVTAIVAGRYGREDHTLISILKNGTLDIKILPRNTAFPTSDGQEQAPPEQDVPLDVPKKTKLYVELTRHEREQAVDMHRQFQQSLCKLRLTSASSYVKVLTDGQGPVSMTAGSAMRLHMTVHGLGPLFKLVLQVMNTGAKPFRQVPVLMLLNEAVYTCRPKQVILPLLVPGVSYDFEVDVSCIDPASGQADAVRVVFINPASSLPLLSALVNMPVSETDEGL